MLKAVEKFPGEASNILTLLFSFESGFAHSVLLKKDGTVWVLGNNGKGQLGLPEVSAVNEPVMINGLSGIKIGGCGKGAYTGIAGRRYFVGVGKQLQPSTHRVYGKGS